MAQKTIKEDSTKEMTVTVGTVKRPWVMAGAAAVGILAIGAGFALPWRRRRSLTAQRRAPLIQGGRNILVSLPFSGISLTQVSPVGRRKPEMTVRGDTKVSSFLPNLLHRARGREADRKR
jgi:hypothetical protein